MRHGALCCGLAVALAVVCGRRDSATPAPVAARTGAVTTLIPTEADEHFTSVPALLQGRVPGLRAP